MGLRTEAQLKCCLFHAAIPVHQDNLLSSEPQQGMWAAGWGQHDTAQECTVFSYISLSAPAEASPPLGSWACAPRPCPALILGGMSGWFKPQVDAQTAAGFFTLLSSHLC